MNIFTQFFKKNPGQSSAKLRNDVRNDLLRREATIGKQIFGKIPEGGNREFFRLDTHTWMWIETFKKTDNTFETKKTMYVVREKEVVKSVNGGSYTKLSIEEAENFRKALKEYGKRVSKQVYNEKFVV